MNFHDYLKNKRKHKILGNCMFFSIVLIGILFTANIILNFFYPELGKDGKQIGIFGNVDFKQYVFIFFFVTGVLYIKNCDRKDFVDEDEAKVTFKAKKTKH